ncbi:dihydrofolate reductase family protein [Pseudonocardia sp. N23]|uniref:dihydrofolate reductase family protein n=1 Tax=Pseudonocardia sp. N23 TaxID=1987376 RepID=UPI000BFC858C|nr:dihydrofolate reductase family protein [Pseudonocardia sp. N23]GAY09580.1 dihydrofolate reductase [Pseudonocardia sp. N23]
MGKVVATISTSVDGYVTGPDDGPGNGLGTGGERLHHWVFGGPWTYDAEPTGEPDPVDRAFLDDAMAGLGAVVCGRNTYDAAGTWGGRNPWDRPLFVVTRRPHEQPAAEQGFTFVDGFRAAFERAQDTAGDRDVCVMGGAETIRQALAVGYADELVVSLAPLVLGGGTRLFEGFVRDIDLERTDVIVSPWATHLRYRIVR